VGATGVRLRQAVLAAAELDPVAEQLRAELGLREPFNDPGVAAFGLRNAVFALGDTFIEVVAPVQPETAAGRYLERRGGDSGYMLIFQLDDLGAARARVKEMGIRVVWQADMPDISGTHLHPADMRGAIVSLDRADPPASWRWGGPAWTGGAGEGAPGRVVGVTVHVTDPDVVAQRWASVLDTPVSGGRLDLDGGFVSFEECANERDEGLTEIVVEVPDEVSRGREAVEIGGARFSFA
jgi:hypothetical protein